MYMYVIVEPLEYIYIMCITFSSLWMGVTIMCLRNSIRSSKWHPFCNGNMNTTMAHNWIVEHLLLGIEMCCVQLFIHTLW